MAEKLEKAEQFPPFSFYSENGLKTGDELPRGLDFGFPAEFPYEFGPNSDLNSPGESVVSSAETESDEEDVLAGLTRELAYSTIQETLGGTDFSSMEELQSKPALSSSPQSTLNGIGNWSFTSSGGSPDGPSQVPSPPTTPMVFNDDAWELIYAAAGQVARLKMGNEGPPQPQYQQNRGLLSLPGNHNSGFYSHPQQVREEQMAKSSVWGGKTKQASFSHTHFHNRARASNGYENGRCLQPLGLPKSAWPPLQAQNQRQQTQHCNSGMRAVFLGGSGVKRECAGTGVFLPRNYNTNSDSRKKSGCSTVLLPERVVQALNLNFEDTNFRSAQGFVAGFSPDHGRRNALMSVQKRSFHSERPLSHEICLPQEWTY